MRTKHLKGGLSLDGGRRQRPLFLSKSAGDGRDEHYHQSAFFFWLKRNEDEHPVLKRFFAIPNGGFRHRTTAAKLRAEGVKPGVLDTCLPVARVGFTGLWIEFKAGRNTLTKEQREWRECLEAEGHKVIVAYNWMAAAQATVEYLSLESHSPIPAS